jgi:hypothetical protein
VGLITPPVLPQSTAAPKTIQGLGKNAKSNALSNGAKSAADQQPFRRRCINQSPAWSLAGNACQRTHCQQQADLTLRPIQRCQIHGDEWAEARLHVADEKVEPVEAHLTAF